VVELSYISGILGFTRKDSAKKLLTKYFIENEDYIYNNGSSNNETILLTIDAFKNFCMQANTKMSNKIRKYYIKLENIINEFILSEYQRLNDKTIRKTELIKEETLIEEYDKMSVVYIGIITIILKNTGQIIKYIKFGESNDIETRVSDHKRNFTNFTLLYVINCDNGYNLEQKFKDIHKKIIIKQEINGHKYIELIIENGLITPFYIYTLFLELKDKYFNNYNHKENIAKYT